MSVTTEAEMVAALESGRSASHVSITMTAGNRAAGTHGITTWQANGGSIPGSSLATCDNTTTGALVLPTSGTGSDLRLAGGAMGGGLYTGQTVMPDGFVEVIDRIAAVGGLVGNVTTLQSINMSTVDLTTARGILTDGVNLAFGIEWYGASGGTSVTMTWGATYWDDTTGTFTTTHPSGGTSGLWQWIRPNSGKQPKALTSVTLSATTGSSTQFGVVACRLLGMTLPAAARNHSMADLHQMALMPVSSSACLQLIARSAYFGAGLSGNIIIAKG